MTLLYKTIFLLLLLAGCTSKAEYNKAGIGDTALANNQIKHKHRFNNVQVDVKEIRICSYPEKDPLFEKKKNKKLLVLQIAVSNLGAANQEDIIPLGAVLSDEKGNSYETSPGVVAMAQSSGCIKGDDLNNYNSIWSGNITAGETRSAFVLGFEMPANVAPEKLYWNKAWMYDDKYLDFSKPDYTIKPFQSFKLQ